jgi:hypothetical protein
LLSSCPHMRSVYEAAGRRRRDAATRRGLARLACWPTRSSVTPSGTASTPTTPGGSPLLGGGARGPRAYSGSLGDETVVSALHAGNGEHEDMDRRAIACFDQAVEDAGLGADDALRHGTPRLLRLGGRRRASPPTPIRPTTCAAGLPIAALVVGRARGRPTELAALARHPARAELLGRRAAGPAARCSVARRPSRNNAR